MVVGTKNLVLPIYLSLINRNSFALSVLNTTLNLFHSCYYTRKLNPLQGGAVAEQNIRNKSNRKWR